MKRMVVILGTLEYRIPMFARLRGRIWATHCQNQIQKRNEGAGTRRPCSVRAALFSLTENILAHDLAERA